MNGPRVVAFVHAKGWSERVPGKNLRWLGDRPLFCHAIAIARATRGVDEVVIDSDHDEILHIGARHGATPLRRPAALAASTATGDDLAFWQASSRPASEIVLQVVPTAPFLLPASVERAIALLAEPGVHSVAGVFSEALYTWVKGRPAYYDAAGRIPNSQNLAPTTWETTGLYGNRTGTVLESRRRLDPERCRPVPLTRIEAIDVNTPADFAFAETVWRGLQIRETHVPASPR